MACGRSWQVSGEPCGLSITPTTANLLVCFPANQRLKEYSHEGKLIHRINLSPAIVLPWRGVELESRKWVVCHGGKEHPTRGPSKHRICRVDGESKEVTKFTFILRVVCNKYILKSVSYLWARLRHISKTAEGV
jgi:hypothetical protein